MVGSGAMMGFGVWLLHRLRDQIKQTVQRPWRDDVLGLGGSEGDRRVIEPAFVYPGFEYPTNPA